MNNAKIGFMDLDRGGGLRIAGAAVVEHQRYCSRHAGQHILGGDERCFTGADRLGEHHGARQHPHAFRQHLMTGNPQPQSARADDRVSRGRGQPVDEALRVVVGDEDRHRPGPAPAGDPATDRTQPGGPVEGFVGALEGQCQPRLAVPHGGEFDEPAHGGLVPYARCNHVVGFGREGDAPALGKRLHGPMHHIPGIVRFSQVDDHWSHGQNRWRG